MKITKKTRVKDILPLLTIRPERLNDILSGMPEYPVYRWKRTGWKIYREPWSILDISVGEFLDFSKDHETMLWKMLSPWKRAWKALGKVKYLLNQLKRIEKLFDQFSIPQSKLEKEAANGVNFPSTGPRMLLTLVQFFHLHSFEEAEKLPVSAFFTILWDQYSSATYQRNYQKISERESKNNNKGNGRKRL